MTVYEPLSPGVEGCLCPQYLVPFTDLGECVVAGDTEGTLAVVRADPAIAVSGRLLHDWHDGTPGYVSLECRGQPDHIGDVIRVTGVDRQVVYVVTRVADRERQVWEARWPD